MRPSIVLPALALLLGTPSPGGASNENVRFLFHLVEIQDGGDGCSQQPTGVPCTQATTQGELEIPYYAYVMVAQGDTALGIAGMVFGIR